MFPKIPTSGPVDLRQAKYAGATPLQGLPLKKRWRHPRRSNRKSTLFFRQMGSCSQQAVETLLVLLDGFPIQIPSNSVSINIYETADSTQHMPGTNSACSNGPTVKMRICACGRHELFMEMILSRSSSPEKVSLVGRILTVGDVQHER